MKNTIFLLLVLYAGLCTAEEKTKIAVMELKAKSGLEETKASTLTDVLCTEIANLGNFDVIGKDDMQAMLQHITDKQLLECDDTKCLAQVGGALGVSRLVAGNIGMLGQTYVINVKLIDIDNATVLNRVSEKFEGGEAGLIDKMGECTRKLFNIKPVEPEKPAPVAQPAKKSFLQSNLFRYGMFGAGLAASGIAYAMYKQGQNLHDNEYTNAATKADADKYWGQLEDYALKTNSSTAFLYHPQLLFQFQPEYLFARKVQLILACQNSFIIFRQCDFDNGVIFIGGKQDADRRIFIDELLIAIVIIDIHLQLT
jgi:TolB-like protein